LGYPFSNKKRKSPINTFSLTTSMSDGEEMELRELSFTPFWNAYPQEQIQQEMAAVALVSPPGWETALSQLLPALFRRVQPRSDLATSCWKASCWCVRQFTKMRVHVHGTWAHVFLPARGNQLTSVWRTGGEPWHPPPSVLLPAWFPFSSCPVPVPRPGASRCRGARLGYACAVATA